MAIKLPTRQARLPIVDSKGVPTSDFLRFLNIDLIGSIQTALNQNADNTAALAAIVAAQQIILDQLSATSEIAQAAQQAANVAQETADAAGGTATSGSATDPAIDVLDDNWVNGPQVDLGSVVAGTLTISGSGPQQDDDVGLVGSGFSGQFRIREIVGGVEETVFTGGFSVSNIGSVVVSNTSASAVQAFSDARTSTGTVSYRLDARRLSGSSEVTSLLLYLFVRRTT